MASFEVANFDTAIANLSKVVRMDEGYNSGAALLNLGLSYMRNGDNDNATNYLNRVIELVPGTEYATEAQNGLNTISQSTAAAGGTEDQAAQQADGQDTAGQ